jgi:hypothetical protein
MRIPAFFHHQMFSHTGITLLDLKAFFAGCFDQTLTRSVIETRIGWIPNGLGLNRCIHIYPGQTGRLDGLNFQAGLDRFFEQQLGATLPKTSSPPLMLEESMGA